MFYCSEKPKKKKKDFKLFFSALQISVIWKNTKLSGKQECLIAKRNNLGMVTRKFC